MKKSLALANTQLSGTSSISQNVTEIANGKYDLHARVKNDNMGNIAYVYAKAKGHPIMKTSASVTTYVTATAVTTFPTVIRTPRTY